MLWWSAALWGLCWHLQSSMASTAGVTFTGLEAMGMGDMLVGIPSRDASAISVLTWDDVSTGWSSSFDSWGRGIRTTTGLVLLRVKFLDPQLDVSSIAWDRRFLTSIVMLPSPSNFGGGFMGTGYPDGGDLAKRQYLLVQLFHWRSQDINFQVDRLACSKTYTAGQQLW